MCDLISIIKKAHKEFSSEQVTSTLAQMFSQREAESIPDLVQDYHETQPYDCIVGDKFTLSKYERVNYIFESAQKPLY